MAAGMVFEERCAPHAIMCGDIDREDAETARQLAAPFLGREVALPVLTDAPRLVERLRTAFGEDLIEPFQRVYCGDNNGFEAILRAFEGEPGARIWHRAVRSRNIVEDMGLAKLLTAWVSSGRDLREACRLACLGPRGHRIPAKHLVEELGEAWDGGKAREPVVGSERTDQAAMLARDAARLMGQGDVHMSAEEMEDVLTSVFGKRGEKLFEELKERQRAIEESSRLSIERFASFAERVSSDPDDDTRDIVKAKHADDLAETQRFWVHEMGWQVAMGLAEVRRRRDIAPALADVAKAKSLVVRTLASNGPVLTEATWETILAESNLEVLAFLLVLAGLCPNNTHGSRVRRALFENVAIREYAMAFARDEHKVRAFEQSVAQGLAPLIHLFERRLGRELAPAERASLRERLVTLGPQRLGDVVLDLSPEELARWLSDPAGE